MTGEWEGRHEDVDDRGAAFTRHDVAVLLAEGS